MAEKIYSTEEIQKVANSIRKQILGVALQTGGCYLAQACSSAEIIASLYTKVMNLGPSVGNWEPIPFPGVPGPDNMDYQRGSAYNGAPAPDKDRFFRFLLPLRIGYLQRAGGNRPHQPQLHGKIQCGWLEHGNDRRGALSRF